MLEISAYPLKIAREELGCSEKYLVRLAAADQLDIYVRLPNHLEAKRLNSDLLELESDGFIQSRLCKVPALTFCDYLSNEFATLDIVKSYDEPDIYYRPVEYTGVGEVDLVVMAADVMRLLESKAVQETTDKQLSESCTAQKIMLDAYIDVPRKADLINLVSLSKAIARRHNMTNGEACDWVITKINPVEAIYDISGSTLPKRIPEVKAVDAVNECFNQNWWNHPENEGKPIPGWNGISANGIAISKADAEKYCFIPSSELEELSAGKLPLCADDLDVAIRINLIDLISLSKAIAKH